MNKLKKILKEYRFQVLSIILIMFYPCYFMYAMNADEINFSEIVIISIVFILIGIIMLLIFKILYKDLNKAALFVDITMLLFLNFSLLYEIISILGISYEIVLIIVVSMIILFGIYIKKKKVTNISSYIFCIIFALLIICNFCISIPKIISKYKVEVNHEQNYSIVDDLNVNTNIYFFIFDEMSGPQALERYCNYDNSELYNQLSDLGFNISKTSHSETSATSVVLPNLLNLQKVVDYNNNKSERIEYRKNPLLYKIIELNNYNLNIIETKNFLGSQNYSKKYNYSYKDFSLEMNSTASYYILRQTIIGRLALYYIENHSNRVESYINALDYCAKSSSNKLNKTFTVFYSDIAHEPWYIDENGNSKGKSYGWNNAIMYLDQLKFAQKEMLLTMNKIIKEDPEAIILIQSDHGIRIPYHLEVLYNIKMEDAELENYYMTNIFNCLYYKGEKIDIEGMSNVNTLKLLLNKIWNTNLEYEELKQYVRAHDDIY